LYSILVDVWIEDEDDADDKTTASLLFVMAANSGFGVRRHDIIGNNDVGVHPTGENASTNIMNIAIYIYVVPKDRSSASPPKVRRKCRSTETPQMAISSGDQELSLPLINANDAAKAIEPLWLKKWWRITHFLGFFIGGTTFIFGTLCTTSQSGRMGRSMLHFSTLWGLLGSCM
jgi:hypothetical protein